jgi:hypothetical protein
LFFLRSCVVYRAIVVCAYGESSSYALAVDDDCGLRGCARQDWLRVRIIDCCLDLAEVPALHGSGSLLSWVSPSVLDLDKLGMGCDHSINMHGEFKLIARSRKALVAIHHV